MKTVVEIVPTTPEMVNIVFDDSTSLAANREIVSHYEIEVSRRIDEATLDRIIDEADGGKCYEAALRYIESRARSADELKRHLLSKHLYSTAAIEHALHRLKQNGLLDDASFAKAWVEDRIRFNPKSRLMLQRELRQKGVSPNEIDTAISNIDDSANAYQAGTKKARSLPADDRLEFCRKLSAYLARRGYSSEVVRKVVNQLWQETSQE